MSKILHFEQGGGPPQRAEEYVAPITASTPGAIAYTDYRGKNGDQPYTAYRMPTAADRSAAITQGILSSLDPAFKARLDAGQIYTNYGTMEEAAPHGGTRTVSSDTIKSFIAPGPNDTTIVYDTTGQEIDRFQNQHFGGGFLDSVVGGIGNVVGGLSSAATNILEPVSDTVQHISDVASNDPNAKMAIAIGLALAMPGIGQALGQSMMSAGLITSAAEASAAVLAAGGSTAAATAAAASATAFATAVGTAAATAGSQIAQGKPLDQAIGGAVTSLIGSQFISPAIASEVKSVISNPAIASTVTNMGTNIATGILQGKSEDQIAKSTIATAIAGAGAYAGAQAGNVVRSSIDDPDYAKIFSDASAAGARAAITGKDPFREAMLAGASSAARPAWDAFGNLISEAGSNIDFSGIKDALQPVSDVATQILSPLEQPIKDIAQAGADKATEIFQPVEQGIKDLASNLPSVDLPSVDLPDVNLGNLKLPNINLPKTTTPATTTQVGGLPSTTSTTPTFSWLDSTPQMLTAAAVQKDPTKLAELKQLYKSMTPYDQGPLSAYDNQEEQASTGGSIGGYATGGTAGDSWQSFVDSIAPKFSKSPTMLEAAPAVQQTPRLGSPKHLRSGLTGAPSAMGMAQRGLPNKYAEAAPAGHKPEFITGVTGYYAQGGGTGQSDDISAMLHDGDYVIDADAVSALGDGSSKAGAEALAKFQARFPHKDDGPSQGRPVAAKIADGEYVFPAAFVTALGEGDNKRGAKLLDAMRKELRLHKRSAPTSKIPPKAESPLDYLMMAKG